MTVWLLLIASVIGLVLVLKLLVRAVQEGQREAGGRRRGGSPRQEAAGSGGGEYGPVNYYANTRHRQKDNWFQFRFQKVGGVWRIYILRMPSLGGRSGSLHRTHRHTDGVRHWICYDPEPRTLKDAQAVTRAWADRELEYIATGVPFEEQHW